MLEEKEFILLGKKKKEQSLINECAVITLLLGGSLPRA